MYRQGDVIFNYGDYGDKYYIILKGKATVATPIVGRSESPSREISLPGSQERV